MKAIATLFFFFTVTPYIFSQQNWGAIWRFGADIGNGNEIDFKAQPTTVNLVANNNYDVGANAVMCSNKGEFQFYTNGCLLVNNQNELMENGDSLSPGFIQDGYCPNGNGGYQPIIALPALTIPGKYYLINTHIEILPGGTAVAGIHLFQHEIDMNENGGLGKVTKKYVELITDTISEYYLTACRHGNGNDWWVCSPEFNGNCYYLVHLADTGTVEVRKECLGSIFGTKEWTGQATFSPDGKKYARFHWEYGLVIFDFDRCTGVFSNPVVIPKWETYQRAGVSFSPNSRYLYTTYHVKLFQFDLQAADIAASKTLIGEYDGFNTPYPTRFFMMGLAPDNKIYIGPPGQSKHFHIIHQPDSAGVACQFEQHGLELATSNFWSFPNFAHYRLGPDSACSSISVKPELGERQPISMEIHPNPASTELEISLPESNNYNQFQLKISNLLGQPLFSKTISETKTTVDVSGFPPGLVLIQVIENGQIRAVGRAVILR